MNRRELLKGIGKVGLGAGLASLPVARLVAQEGIESKLAEIEQFVKVNPTNQYTDSGKVFEYKGDGFTVRVDNTGISLQSITDKSSMVYRASQRDYGNPVAMGYAPGRVNDSESRLMEGNVQLTDEILSNNVRLMGEVNVERGRMGQTITPYQKQIIFKVGKDGAVRGYDFFRGKIGAPEDITAYWTFRTIADNYNSVIDQIHASLIKKPESLPKR